MRTRLAAFVTAGLLLAPCSAGTAATAAGTTTTTEQPVQIAAGLELSGAVITGPPPARPRRLSAYQSAVFVQAWLAEGIYGKPRHIPPPAGVKVYRVAVTGTWDGGPPARTLFVYYASDGKQAWIALPVGPAGSTKVPPSRWFIAPARTIQAFAGTAQLVPTAGTATSTPGTARASAAPAELPTKNRSAGSSTAWWWIIAAAAGAAGAAGAGLFAVRRARR